MVRGFDETSYRAKRDLPSRVEREDIGLLINILVQPRAEREAKKLLVNLHARLKREANGSSPTYYLERSERLRDLFRPKTSSY